MSDWELAASLATLRKQVDRLWPNRSKASDGTIGDAAHAARASDHNPNGHGVVTAIDITEDPAHGADMHLLAERLRRSQDPRIAYIIWDRRICDGTAKSGTGGGDIDVWHWRPYTGSDPHTNHLHLSVSGSPLLYGDGSSWRLGLAAKPTPRPVRRPDPAPQPAPNPKPKPVKHKRPPKWFRTWLRRWIARWF